MSSPSIRTLTGFGCTLALAFLAGRSGKRKIDAPSVLQRESTTVPARAPAQEERISPACQPKRLQKAPQFQIKLQQAYYGQGIVNPGAHASRFLGEHDEPLTVTFGDATPPVRSRIDRRANPGGYVRAVGGNGAIRDWFHANFVWGDVVHAEVIDRNTILLHAKAAA